MKRLCIMLCLMAMTACADPRAMLIPYWQRIPESGSSAWTNPYPLALYLDSSLTNVGSQSWLFDTSGGDHSYSNGAAAGVQSTETVNGRSTLVMRYNSQTATKFIRTYVNPNSMSWCAEPRMLAFWINVISNQTQGANIYQQTTVEAYGNLYRAVQIYGSGASKRIQYFYYDTANHAYTSSASITTGQWHHVAIWSSNAQSRIYINGVLDTTNAQSWVGNASAGVVRNHGIACGPDSTANAFPFTGYLDDLRYDNTNFWSAVNIGELYTNSPAAQ